jgi:hypothetical protein
MATVSFARALVAICWANEILAWHFCFRRRRDSLGGQTVIRGYPSKRAVERWIEPDTARFVDSYVSGLDCERGPFLARGLFRLGHSNAPQSMIVDRLGALANRNTDKECTPLHAAVKVSIEQPVVLFGEPRSRRP